MKLSDLIAGGALFIGGLTIYYSNPRNPAETKKLRRIGLSLMFVGVMLAIGEWMVNLILQGG